MKELWAEPRTKLIDRNRERNAVILYKSWKILEKKGELMKKELGILSDWY